MTKIRLLALLATTAVACKIDSLPPRPSPDGATDLAGASGMDLGRSIDGGDAGVPQVDSGGSFAPDLSAGSDSPLDLRPVVVIDVGTEPGPEAGSETASGVEPRPESEPDAAADGGPATDIDATVVDAPISMGGTGGAVATGGTVASGGAIGNGGVTGTGGAPGTGGTPAACQENATRCSGNGVQTCADGQWGTVVVCGTRQSCAGSADAAKCTCNVDPVCSTVGETCASASTLANCMQDAQACFYESSAITCSNGACSGAPGSAVCCGNGVGANCLSSTSLQTCTAVANACPACASSTCANGCSGAAGSAACCANAVGTSCLSSTSLQTCTAVANGCPTCSTSTCANGCSGATGSAACTVAGPLQWRPVNIPNLPPGSALPGLWTGARGDIYVMATLIAAAPPNTPETWIYHRTSDGTWSTLLHVTDGYGTSGEGGTVIWGTGPADIFAAMMEFPSGTSGGCGSDCNARIYHSSDGSTFAQQTLPSGVGSGLYLGQFGGTPNDVYTTYGNGTSTTGILHYQNENWSVAQDCFASTSFNGCGPLAYIGPNEIYSATCWGYTAWDGSTWTPHPGFDFCDIEPMWGIRDVNGLHLYMTGDNNFGNCEKVWQFTQTGAIGVGSWGSKYGYIQQDCNVSMCGSGTGMWGTAANDIWVTARRGGSGCPGQGGHMYHYNGTSWPEDTTVGLGTLEPYAVWGTATDDVWVAAQDDSTSATKAPSQLFHYGYVP